MYLELLLSLLLSKVGTRIEIDDAHPVILICLKTNLLEELFMAHVHWVTDHIDDLMAGSLSLTPVFLVFLVVILHLVDFLLCDLLDSTVLESLQARFLVTVGLFQPLDVSDVGLICHLKSEVF